MGEGVEPVASARAKAAKLIQVLDSAASARVKDKVTRGVLPRCFPESASGIGERAFPSNQSVIGFEDLHLPCTGMQYMGAAIDLHYDL